MRVLVIEDDRSVRETLGIVLESYDYEVDLVDGGAPALEYLSQTWPDVMLLDLSLNGMSGEEVFNKIKEQFGSVPPTVVLSAVSQGEKRIRNMPGARFLAKPYTLDQLIGILKEVHDASSAA
ncbi:MAG: response regulator [Methylotenera sp.]|nr:response regulator [Oligoflexia bacterium]